MPTPTRFQSAGEAAGWVTRTRLATYGAIFDARLQGGHTLPLIVVTTGSKSCDYESADASQHQGRDAARSGNSTANRHPRANNSDFHKCIIAIVIIVVVV
jgi:hypothetical protein